MKILVACEFSGRVRDAFLRHGHEAVSCDLRPSESSQGVHFQDNVLNHLNGGYDCLIAFPDCTYLCSSGLHWNRRVPGRAEKTLEALDFVRCLLSAPIPHIALENPIGRISTAIRRPEQIIQPWMFGEDASKATCLWLKGLPKLQATHVLKKSRYANQTSSGQNKLGPGPDRAKIRSITYLGIAEAMASQWGNFLK